MIFQDISGYVLNIQKDVDKSIEINSIYHELSNKEIKGSVLKETKDDFELSRKRLEILETQPKTRMYNTIIKQKKQLSRDLTRKMIFFVNLWIVLQIAS